VARFTREAYAAAQLSHPNIVQIHDIGEVDGSRFFSMEFVLGRSLADVVRSQGSSILRRRWATSCKRPAPQSTLTIAA